MSRYLNVILISLIIVTAIVGFYVLYPKYQFVVRDDTVYKLNKITGEIKQQIKPSTPASDKLDKILSGINN